MTRKKEVIPIIVIIMTDKFSDIMNDKELTEYQRICEKLGFIPSEYKSPKVDTEDDNWVNPFSVLTIEEQDFLYEHGYLSKS